MVNVPGVFVTVLIHYPLVVTLSAKLKDTQLTNAFKDLNTI